MRPMRIVLLILSVCVPMSAFCVPSIVEKVGEGVYVVRDDHGRWGGMTTGITHQSKADYLARKTLDLSALPDDVWEQVKAVRLSAMFLVRDYSWHDNPQADGLDETFEFIVNGNVHSFPTNCGAPVYPESGSPAAVMNWYDIAIPKEHLTRGANEIIFHKGEDAQNDDYLYLAIDNSENRGNSAVAFDGKTWTQEKLTIPGGNGEYMIRLYLITGTTRIGARWRPGRTPEFDDPWKLFLYAGAPEPKVTPTGLTLADGQSARLEWRPAALDRLEPAMVTVEGAGTLRLAWIDEKGKPGEATDGYMLKLPGNRQEAVSGLAITAAGGEVTVSAVTVDATVSYHPVPPVIDMCPVISNPAGAPRQGVKPSVAVQGNTITLENATLTARFATGGRLALTSIRNAITDCEMVRRPSQVDLLLVEVDGKRYSGSDDFACSEVTQTQNGFSAVLTLPDPAMRATFTAEIDDEGLRMGLDIINSGETSLDFKLAFPHLAGLAVSDEPADDYYFYPAGGGIVASEAAIIREGYGDYGAMYQVMDVFSPSRGGGVYVRADDAEGWHKVMALRKYIPGAAESNIQRVVIKTAPEYLWTNPLGEVEGTGLAYEYQRRTRGPGTGLRPATAVIAAHAGDWHTAMERYSAWAHDVWQFRPYPSKLKHVHNMMAAGWGQGYLFRDGAYRTDIVRENTDCIELMSWWEWSPLGPWSTPFDKLEEVLGEATYKRWTPYFVKDPVTGEMMWNNQPGDYDGYNERFGGLPAFQQAVQTYKDMGALVTLYTDPFRMDDASKIGQAHGKEWGVVDAEGKHTTSYEVWNPCHDNPDVRDWVVETMGRVMRETGADGIRLDEYGHRGWACFSDLHEHTWSEPGVTQWNKAVTDTIRRVHEEMDEVKPDSVLTTEFPAYDYMMQHLEGCITYDVTSHKYPIRPLECNIQRFYFPECMPYELDHQGNDPGDRNKFWNAVESFGRYYPWEYYTILRENEDLYYSRDCYPLMPTVTSRVYVNRFSGDGKTIFHVYNALGHTFDGPAVRLALAPGRHVFDLLACRDARVQLDGQTATVSVYLPRDSVACVAVLPRTLQLKRVGGTLGVEVDAAPEGNLRLVVSDVTGRELLSQPAGRGEHRINLGEIEAGKTPACVKLLSDGQLVDAAGIGR